MLKTRCVIQNDYDSMGTIDYSSKCICSKGAALATLYLYLSKSRKNL